MNSWTEYPSGTRKIGWLLAVALLAVGGATLFEALFPLRPGDADWEVGAIGQAVSSAAVFAIGWAGLSWLSLTSTKLNWLARTMGFVGVGLAVVAAFGAILVASNIPLVWNAAKASGSLVQAAAYKTAALKAASLAGLYAIFLLGFSAMVLRNSFTRN